jgi:hypothetical protein
MLGRSAKNMPLSNTNTNTLVIYPSKIKATLVFLGAAGFVIFGMWFACSESRADASIKNVIMIIYIGIPFFSLCGLYAMFRLVRKTPALLIDSTGITDSASACSVGYLSWNEIDFLLRYEYRGQEMLGIFPKNLNVFLLQQNLIKRLIIKANLSLGCAPANIPQIMLPITIKELLIHLHTRHGVLVRSSL